MVISMEKKRILYGLIYATVFLMIISAVSAAGEIVQTANKLNYWDAENHIVTVENTGTASTNVTIAIPSGWSWVSGSTCTNIGTDIECLLAGSSSGSYTVQSPGSSSPEYDVDKFVVATNNSYTGNNVSMLRIQCGEIFHTLVEYGRGRGNYFYNSNSGRAGSGQTGTGCAYLPNGSFIELNFLHKIYNIKQYYGVVADAYNASYTCTYPNDTIVRQHLDTSIARGADWTVNYEIDEIGGSWERFGYLGMQFDSGAYSVGQSIAINCTDIQYQLPVAGGNMSCSEDSFSLQFRDREPFIASASTAATIYNGTQEVEITYNITNNEVYDASDVIIEIQAPKYATFIGTRGELWGYGLDQYRIEKSELENGDSEVIVLVARFDTSAAPSITALNLSEGIKVKYTTCWEANAYNPTEYIQDITITNTGTVNMAQATAITSVQTRLQTINTIVTAINTTITVMNTTLVDVETFVIEINATTHAINTTLYNEVMPYLRNLSANISFIKDRTYTLEEYLNCTIKTNDSICFRLELIQNYTDSLEGDINLTLETLKDVNTTLNSRFDAVDANLTEIKGLINNLSVNVSDLYVAVQNLTNCTQNPNAPLCVYLKDINSTVININTTTTNILDVVNYINQTRWGTITAQQIYDAIENLSLSVDVSEVLSEIRQLREFDEELVFLVTDSFIAQAEAREFADNGDLGSAAEKLLESKLKLDQATSRLDALKQQTLTEQEAAAIGDSFWWIWLVLVGLLVATVIYLFQRVPEEPPRIF